MVGRATFPTKHARELADKAAHAENEIDDLSESAAMTVFIDTWLAVYRAAGGLEKKK